MMAEEEHCEEVNISDVIDDSESYNNLELRTESEVIESDSFNTIQDSEIINSEDQILEDTKPQIQNKSEVIRSTKLPIARIKNIMKMDPDVSVVSGEAVFLVTKATELFLETIAKETYAYTLTNKKKTISKKDLDLVINKVDCLCFLEGAMDF